MNVYLYGIARWPVPSKSKAAGTRSKDARSGMGTGVGDPPRPVELLRHRSLAALLSRVVAEDIGSGQGTRGLRRDMKAHANVLNSATAAGATILPVQFGIILQDEQSLVDRLLDPQYRQLDALLTSLEGCVEVTLKAQYREAQALQEVVSSSPQLAREAVSLRGRSSANAYQSKIELGKRVAQELRARRDRDASWLLDALGPVVRDAKVKTPGGELTVLNASFLVPRQGMPSFDEALLDVAGATKDRMRLDCVGPLPPYSFVDLRIS
jgi:hypothetical protein